MTDLHLAPSRLASQGLARAALSAALALLVAGAAAADGIRTAPPGTRDGCSPRAVHCAGAEPLAGRIGRALDAAGAGRRPGPRVTTLPPAGHGDAGPRVGTGYRDRNGGYRTQADRAQARGTEADRYYDRPTAAEVDDWRGRPGPRPGWSRRNRWAGDGTPLRRGGRLAWRDGFRDIDLPARFYLPDPGAGHRYVRLDGRAVAVVDRRDRITELLVLSDLAALSGLLLP